MDLDLVLTRVYIILGTFHYMVLKNQTMEYAWDFVKEVRKKQQNNLNHVVGKYKVASTCKA